MAVAWHGGSPKVSTSCIEPKGNTFYPENPQVGVDWFQLSPSDVHLVEGRGEDNVG